MRLSIYIASSANGLISNSSSIPDWLSAEFGQGFMAITQKTKAVIMGKTTYNFLLPDNLPLQNEGTTVVLTKHKQTKSSNPTVVFTKSSAAKIVEMLEKKGHTEAVIIGGEMTISYFLDAGLVNDIYFVVEPVLFGSGLLFFKNKELDIRLNLLEVTKLNTDTVQLHYKIQKQPRVKKQLSLVEEITPLNLLSIIGSKHVLFIHGAGNGGYEEDAALVASLRKALGTAYKIHFPKMETVETPYFGSGWVKQIGEEISSVKGEIILAGHSLGASMLLKYLSENKIKENIVGIFLVAPPFWRGKEDWVQPLKLQENFSDKLPKNIPIYFYHCKDDDVVPFEQCLIYKQNIPWAIFREMLHGGHQLNNDLTAVVNDIKSL